MNVECALVLDVEKRTTIFCCIYICKELGLLRKNAQETLAFGSIAATTENIFDCSITAVCEL